MTMMTMFSALWSQLESEATEIKEQGTLKRLIGTNDKCPMFLGIRQPGFRRAFIIQVPRDIAPFPEALPDSKGFDFHVLIAGDESRSEYLSIMLCAAKTDYHDVFAAICDDLYSKLDGLTTTREVVYNFLSRVRLWQIFFEKQAAEGLSLEAQQGLYGELYFLNKFVLANCVDERALRYWVGTENRQHDFQFGSMSVEVKTSSAKQHQRLHVASEQQLDETFVDRLYLFYLSISLVENTTATLPALIDNIRQTLNVRTSALDLFDNILLERGYADAQRTAYERTGYSIRRSGFLEVCNDFPRIRESDIRIGVGDVTYSISLDACSDYDVAEGDFLNELRGIL